MYSVSQATGTILVRDRPARMDMIRKYIEDTNTAMSRQVDVGVTIYRVMVNDKDVRGMNWNVMFQTLLASSGYNLSITTPRPNVIGDGLSSAIIKVPERDENGAPYRYGGSQMFVDALSTLGRTSVVQNTSVLTSNNQPAPIKVVRRLSYLAETTPTYISGGTSAVTTGAALTPGTVETGLNIYVLPHVQDDGKRMLLKLMVSMSTLEKMDSYSSGEASIQLPQVASREFNQQAWINSGRRWFWPASSKPTLDSIPPPPGQVHLAARGQQDCTEEPRNGRRCNPTDCVRCPQPHLSRERDERKIRNRCDRCLAGWRICTCRR